MEEIRYRDVADLGFTTQVEHDNVFEDEYGVPYIIVKKDLTKKICIYWDQVTRTCEMIRIYNQEEGNVIGRMDIQDLNHLKQMIKFFDKR